MLQPGEDEFAAARVREALLQASVNSSLEDNGPIPTQKHALFEDEAQGAREDDLFPASRSRTGVARHQRLRRLGPRAIGVLASRANLKIA